MVVASCPCLQRSMVSKRESLRDFSLKMSDRTVDMESVKKLNLFSVGLGSPDGDCARDLGSALEEG